MSAAPVHKPIVHFVGSIPLPDPTGGSSAEAAGSAAARSAGIGDGAGVVRVSAALFAPLRLHDARRRVRLRQFCKDRSLARGRVRPHREGVYCETEAPRTVCIVTS